MNNCDRWMRVIDIAYKAKRVDNGELVYGYPCILAEGTPYEQIYILEPYEIIPETLEKWK